MWDKIKNLNIIKSTISSLNEKRHNYISPVLTHEEDMRQVLIWVKESNENRQRPLDCNNSYYKFLAIVTLLYYFSPSCIADERISDRKRCMFARAMNCNPTFISHKKKDILFLYNNDKVFRKDIDEIVAYIDTKLASR